MAMNQGKPIPSLSARDIERFWSKVDRGLTHQCWPWMGCRDRDGYGIFRLANRNIKSHRVAAYLKTAGLSNLFVLHSCDNPICCNPDHLREGTAKENSEDRDCRGRGIAKRNHWTNLYPEMKRLGEKNPHAKLTADSVALIRDRHASGISQSQLGREFGVSQQSVRSIVLRETWRHI